MYELNGKAALVTGGSRGIGAATAILLAEHGADVAISYVSRPDLAAKVAKAIEAKGRRALAVQSDVTDADGCAKFVDRVAATFGRLDVLFNNAGGPAPGNIDPESDNPATLDTWHRAVATHVNGPFYCTRAAIPHMKKQGGGVIINMASVAAHRGAPGIIAYQTVKSTVLGFTRGCARDLADLNIRVNCVSPGLIQTDFHARMTDEQRQHILKNRIPLHRIGTPEHIALAVLQLITNDYITGENLTIDAGLISRIA